NAGDSLSYHNNAQFSTLDSDNDYNTTGSCAEKYSGGWWYKDCHESNLNGKYSSSNGDVYHIHWKTLNAAIKYVEMKIKAFSKCKDYRGSILRTMDTDQHKGFNIQLIGTQTQVIVKTSQKQWELTFAVQSYSWVHVCITWSEANGIKYYEDGRLKASNTKYKRVSDAPAGTRLWFGEGSSHSSKCDSRLRRLGIWSHELQQYAIDDVYNYDNFTFDVDKQAWQNVRYYAESLNHHFNWLRRSGCTPSEGTGPCVDNTWKNPLGSYLYAEASTPLVKGNFSVITSPIITPVYRCLRFWYHMRGTGEGYLTLDTPPWRANQNNRNDWQQAQVSYTKGFIPDRVTFRSYKNKNYESDIAIDDISFDVRPCVKVSVNVTVKYENIGCYNEHGTMGSLEGLQPLTYDPTEYAARTDAILKCAKTAKTYGYSVFGLKNGYCKASSRSHLNYDKHGSRSCPADGRGSTSVIQIYRINVLFIHQKGEKPNISLRVTFSTKSCRYNIPVYGGIWSQFGFSFKDSSTLNVYHNGRPLNIPMSKSCRVLSTTVPQDTKLRVGLITQNTVFQIDDFAIWNKWLNETDFLYRYQHVSVGRQQKINLILKLTDEVWDDSLNDLESENARKLMKIITDSFQVIMSTADNKQPIIVNIAGFSNGSVNVNVTILFGSLTYNDTLLLENWLYEKQKLNNMSVSVQQISSSTVPAQIPLNLTAVNTSSTSLFLNWSHIVGGGNIWRGHPLGYRIVYWSPEVPSDPIANTTVLPNTSFHELKSLRKYIAYCVKVAGYNNAGDGNYTEPLCLKTQEDVPDAPPDNIEIRNITKTVLLVTSTGVPLLNRNGILLNYTVYWISYDGSSHGMSSCVNSTLITCEITGLKSYSWYNVTITSYTRIGAGHYSVWYTVLTDESVPSIAPSNFIGYNTSSTSIYLSWSTIPPNHHNGRFSGYVIRYAIKGSNDWNKIWVCDSSTATNLTELQEYREYNITIDGFTAEGRGNFSNISVWTDQDIPASPPLNLTGTNLSSSSIRLQWKPVPYEYARGIILGYAIRVVSSHIVYNNLMNTASYDVIVQGGENTNWTFISLEMYTDYTYQILAFTVKGNGNFSKTTEVRTDEDGKFTPFQRPSNVTAKSILWHTIQMNWTLIPSDQIPGICRGYVIRYIRKEGTKDVPRNVTVSANTNTALITNLAGYILYDFWISGLTYPTLIGPNTTVTLRTIDWLPRIPPPNFTVVPDSSTSLRLSWDKLPLELTNGVMVGYVVEYNNTNKSIADNATYPTQTTSAVLTGLRKFNYYRLRIIAQNIKGFGRYWSSYLTVRTNEDSPDQPPANSSAQSNSPTAILIEWNPVPSDYRNGFITGHSVFYRAISQADVPLLYEPIKRIDVGAETFQLLIDGLPSYTEYSVIVLAQTVKGDGVKAASMTASTCRCFEVLTTNWREMPPYVTYNKTAPNTKPKGMFPHIVERAIVDCCRYCRSHGLTKLNFYQDGYNKPSNKSKDIDVKSNIDDETDIHFPIFGYQDQTHYSKYYGYIPIVPTSGVAFIVNKKQSKASPNNVAQAVFNCWPLLMLNVIIAFLVGCIIWALDSKHNPDHFDGSFIRGVASGFWFAFITFTTVGYGDKTVVSIPARVFTVFWTLFGLVTFGILMGSFSAAFESMTFEETQSSMMLYGTKVATLDNSSEHRLGLRKNAKVNS
ncbi:hypothetical protein QZH41_017706, partial [Actinostola sp. cb2023]